MKRALGILAAGVAASAAIVAARWAAHEGRGSPAVESRPAAPRGVPDPTIGRPPLKPGDRIPDATLLAQDGRSVSLSGYRGKTLLLSFLYTRCNVASMCPMATQRLQELQSLARKRNLDAQFLVVSFDPADRPEVLRDYARLHEVDLSNWDFATAPAEVLEPLARAFNVYFRRTVDGAFEHNITLSLVDSQGLLRDDFFGTGWDVEDVLGALAKAKS